MKDTVLKRLCCAVCRGSLAWQTFRQEGHGEIADGVAWCTTCHNWYAITDALLELLPPKLAYRADRARFWAAHRKELTGLGLKAPDNDADCSAVAAQRKQQEHFDWYGNNDQQTYSTYESMPFWTAVDAMVFEGWRRQVKPDGWLLDVGCAQGRSTFKFLDLPLHVVGFDVSKTLVRQARDRYRSGGYSADATFFVGDGSQLPFLESTFDYVLIYGVLHHLPDPAQTCRDVARILQPGGIYFGSENNQTVFRKVFDWLMKINPLWHEEAGSQPLISAQELAQWFAGSPVRLECHTQVFVPPHLVNLLGQRWGSRLLHLTDWVGRHVPYLRNNGGLVMIHGRHDGQAAVAREGGGPQTRAA